MQKNNSAYHFFQLAAFISGLFLITGCAGVPAEQSSDTGRKAAFIIPYREYEPTEFGVPWKLLDDAGHRVTVVSTKTGKASSGGHSVNVDLLIDELNVKDYDAIVFIGGMGVPEYLENETAHRVAREAADQGKILAAICWAPVILANAGVLEGKEVTASWKFDEIEKHGGKVVKKNLVTDGNIITANGPDAAYAFGKAILDMLALK